jgi:hypothetical protein
MKYWALQWEIQGCKCLDKSTCLQAKSALNVREWCVIFKQTCHLHTVISKQSSMECQKWCAIFKQIFHLPPMITKQKSMECQQLICHVQTDMSLTYCDYKTKEHGMSKDYVPCSNRHVTYSLWLQNRRAWNIRNWCAMSKQTYHLPPLVTKQDSMECQKVICHIQTCMSLTTCDCKTENMECQKVMCHFQTDISLTTCDYKTKSMECQKVIWHVPTDMSLTYFDFF